MIMECLIDLELSTTVFVANISRFYCRILANNILLGSRGGGEVIC